MEVDINNIIKKYHLKKHPEGGYYSRFYESKTRCILSYSYSFD